MIVDTCPIPDCGFQSPELLPGVIDHLCAEHIGALPDHELVIGAAVARTVIMDGDGLSNLVFIAAVTQTLHDDRTEGRLDPDAVEIGVAELVMYPDSARHLGQLLIQSADQAEGIAPPPSGA